MNKVLHANYENCVGEGNLAGAGEGVELQGTEQGHKTRMYEVLVLSTLLYTAETWTMKEKQNQRLRVFQMACLRKIEGVTRRDRIRNEEIFNSLNIRI